MRWPVSTPGWSPGITCGGNVAVIADRSSPAARGSSAARCAPCARRPVRDSSGGCSRVVASAEDTGAGTCIVRIEADRSTERRTMAGEGAAVTAVGALGLLVTGLLAGPVVLVVAPVVALAGVGVAARGRGRADRVEHEVGLVLDAVEQGSDPTRLATDVVRRVSGRRRPR